jgi:hypothetical protein
MLNLQTNHSKFLHYQFYHPEEFTTIHKLKNALHKLSTLPKHNELNSPKTPRNPIPKNRQPPLWD